MAKFGGDPTLDPAFIKKSPKSPKRPKQTYKPTQAEIDVSLKRGEEAELAAKNKKMRELAASLNEKQLEGIRLGENFIGWDTEGKKAYYGTPQPTLKPGQNKIAQLQKTSTSFAPQRRISEPLAYLGVPGMGMLGTPFIAAKGAVTAKTLAAGAGAAAVFTKRMRKILAERTGELKKVTDIPTGKNEAFSVAHVHNRSRKMFGENPARLNPDQEHLLWEDVTGKLNLSGARKAKNEKAEIRSDAAKKIEEVERKTGRQETGAGQKVTMQKEASSADAAGTTGVSPGQAVPVKSQGQTTRATSDDKGVRSKLRQQVADDEAKAAQSGIKGQQDPGAVTKGSDNLAGKRMTDEEIGVLRSEQAANRATAARRAQTKAEKKALRESNKEAKAIAAEAKIAGNAAEGDLAAAGEALDALRGRLSKVANTADDAAFNPGRKAVVTLESRINKLKKDAKASGAEEVTEAASLERAAKRRAALQKIPAGLGKDADYAGHLRRFEKMSPNKQGYRDIKKRVEELAGTPLEELSKVERLRFVGSVMSDIYRQEKVRGPRGALGKVMAEGKRLRKAQEAKDAQKAAGQAEEAKELKRAQVKASNQVMNTAMVTGLGLGAAGLGLYSQAEAEIAENEANAAQMIKNVKGASADRQAAKATAIAQDKKKTETQPWKSGEGTLPSNWLNLYIQLYSLPDFAGRRDHKNSSFNRFRLGTNSQDQSVKDAGIRAARKDFLKLVGILERQTQTPDLLNVVYDRTGPPSFDVEAIIESISP